MKREKMSLEKMQTSVLTNLLSREEMKLVMAGSGPPDPGCGACSWQETGVLMPCHNDPAFGCVGCGNAYC